MKRLVLFLAVATLVGCDEKRKPPLPTPLLVGDVVYVKGTPELKYSVTKITGCEVELLHVNETGKPNWYGGKGGPIKESRIKVPITSLQRTVPIEIVDCGS